MDRFVGHNCSNYQGVAMSESKKVMDVSSRGSLDTACTSAISADLMLRRWAFLAELDSPPPANDKTRPEDPPKIPRVVPPSAVPTVQSLGNVQWNPNFKEESKHLH